MDLKTKINNKLKWLDCFHDHFKNREPTYNSIGQIGVIIALIFTAIALRDSSRAVKISNEALDYTREALEIQNREFYIRNRPYITISNVKFSGSTTNTTGDIKPHSIILETRNISDVPATSANTVGRLFLNDIELSGTVTSSGLLVKDIPMGAILSVEQHVYDQIMDSTKIFEVHALTTYFGILNDKHETFTRVRYYHNEKLFKVVEQNFKL